MGSISIGTKLHNNLGQVVHTDVPLSSSSITGLLVKGWWSPSAGKVTTGQAESNGSLPLGNVLKTHLRADCPYTLQKSSVITNRQSTTCFPMSYELSAYVTPNYPHRVAQKVNLSFLWIKFKFNRIVCYKFSLCENFQWRSCSRTIPLSNHFFQQRPISMYLCLRRKS